MADATAILDGRPATAAEVDALVATQVMGWTAPRLSVAEIPPFPRPPLGQPGGDWSYSNPPADVEAWRSDYHWRGRSGDCWRTPPAFSTDIAAAWRVTTERADWLPSLTWQSGIFRGDYARMGWFCDFRSTEHHGYAAAPTGPLAISLAALLASGACRTAEAVLAPKDVPL